MPAETDLVLSRTVADGCSPPFFLVAASATPRPRPSTNATVSPIRPIRFIARTPSRPLRPRHALPDAGGEGGILTGRLGALRHSSRGLQLLERQTRVHRP